MRGTATEMHGGLCGVVHCLLIVVVVVVVAVKKTGRCKSKCK